MPVSTYLLVALGGAMGSVLRAWMAIAVARVTGPAFPWGTILINILGSCFIGFFGTLTAGGARLPLSPETRAFVMIGICGGFTTFSSFSLQTLDLFRDDRAGQALANVVLSVVLCLGAVTAGYFGAVALNHARPGATAEKLPAGTVYAILERPERAGTVLAAARHLASFDPARRIEALAIYREPDTALSIDDVASDAGAVARLAVEEHWPARTQAIFDRWNTEKPALYRQWAGEAGDVISDNIRSAAGIVMAAPGAEALGIGGGEHARHALHAALFATATPVLLVPERVAPSFGRVVAIAWRDDDHARKALQASLPILKQAAAVHLLRTGEVVPPAMLSENGIAAIPHSVPDGGEATGECLLDAVHRVGADLLVMGAFTHSEWREAMLGGVTRYMLAHADIPLFLRH